MFESFVILLWLQHIRRFLSEPGNLCMGLTRLLKAAWFERI